ncbi:CBL-interacting protein kinase 22 [Triticum urartu]|uniref:non-specific serine/threonine protein kinase n=1 Tax=Triticum urartu TaxID=4572 RepID=M7YZQ3_TRIUA|nr:CBL-interacting protein kinase 22 [Triticum urartu]
MGPEDSPAAAESYSKILYKKRYDAGGVDVWSSGVALFSLTAGYLPFNDGNLMGMYRKIFSGRFRCPRWFSPELRSLIGRMLDPDADTRIKIGEIMEHPWVQQDGTSSFDIIRAPSSDPSPEVMKWEAEMEQVRELNAFDIIALASGCDLSGLFGPLPDRVRFAVEGVDIGLVLDKAEEIGREEGFAMRRKEEVGCGGIMFEAIQREIIALKKNFKPHKFKNKGKFDDGYKLVFESNKFVLSKYGTFVGKGYESGDSDVDNLLDDMAGEDTDPKSTVAAVPANLVQKKNFQPHKFKNKGKFDGKAKFDGKNKAVQHTNFKKKNDKKKGEDITEPNVLALQVEGDVYSTSFK